MNSHQVHEAGPGFSVVERIRLVRLVQRRLLRFTQVDDVLHLLHERWPDLFAGALGEVGSIFDCSTDDEVPSTAGKPDTAALAAELDAARATIANLEEAVASNRDIGAAIGVVMASHRLTQDEAFGILRRHSQASHRKLRDIASDVLLTGALPDLPRTASSLRPTPRAVGRREPARRPAPVAQSNGKRYRIELTFARDQALVSLEGEIDLQSVPDVTQLLISLDQVDLPVCVDLTRVSFIDSAGLAPLIDATCRRRTRHRPPLVVEGVSRSAQRLLEALRLDGRDLTSEHPTSEHPGQLRTRGRLTV